MSALERISIYSDAYFARLFEALKIDFEAMYKILGDEDFYDLVLSYLQEQPSTSTSIEEVGAKLPWFIGKFNQTSDVLYLEDLATFEWGLVESFFADDMPSFDQKSLQNLSPSTWEEIKLGIDASIRLLRTHWPVYKIWEARKSFITPEIVPSLSFYLTHRNNYTVQVREINEAEFNALTMAQKGCSLGLLCQKMNHTSSDELMGMFQNWMQTGIVRSLSV